MRIGIIGSNGQLGTELQRASWPSGTRLEARSHAELDISEPLAVARFAAEVDLVVNAAAYTAVDKAEAEPQLAFRANRDGARHLAVACEQAGRALIHVSTDYVFDGTKSGAYQEDDAIAPLGVYGTSKAEGEAAVRAECSRHVILRTSWVVSAYGNNFVKTMLRLARERDRLRVVADQRGRPTPTSELARAITAVAQRQADSNPIPAGTYHWAGAGCASWHELASEVVQLQAPVTGRQPPVDAIATSDYPTPARRPANSELDTRKLERELGLSPAAWQLGVAAIVKRLCTAA
jgi:dTDP-4-dehydrorhamnose reductase